LNIVTLEDELVLLRLGFAHSNTFQHLDVTSNLLAQEVTNLHRRATVLDDAVDGEMSVYCAHFVLETLGDTGDHVGDETLNCPQASNMLPASLPYSQSDLVALALEQPDVHINVTDILVESAPRALDGDQS